MIPGSTYRLGMMACAYSPRDSRRLRQKDYELIAVLGSIARPCLKKSYVWWLAPVVPAGRLRQKDHDSKNLS